MSDEAPPLKVVDLPPMPPRWFVVCTRCESVMAICVCEPSEEELEDIRKDWASDHDGEGPTIKVIGPCTVYGLPGDNKIVEEP